MTELRLGLTPQQAATLLGVSKTTIYRAMKLGEIGFEVVSGRKIIRASELIERFGPPVEVPSDL